MNVRPAKFNTPNRPQRGTVLGKLDTIGQTMHNSAHTHYQCQEVHDLPLKMPSTMSSTEALTNRQFS